MHQRLGVRGTMNDSRTRGRTPLVLPPLPPTDLALFNPDDAVPGVSKVSSRCSNDSVDLGNGMCRSGKIIDAL